MPNRRHMSAKASLAAGASRLAREMRLDDLIPGAPPAAQDLEITDLVFDDRLACPGSLFFCVPGFTRGGHDFAGGAVARGAVALVVERPLSLGVPEVLVNSVREAMAHAAAR